MKNKMHYLLMVLYVCMIPIVLYMNGVFSGDMSSWMNLAINLVFLLVIGILFLISIVSFGRLNRCTRELSDAAGVMLREYREGGGRNLWEKYQDKKDLFSQEPLRLAYTKYRHRMRGGKNRRGRGGICDIEDYINEDLLDQVGMSYFNSGMPGTLTGLGILGTFLGLSLGLGSFSGDDIYTISDNVGPLLSGMKVAFHTSVYGIFFSLVFNFAYRGIMSDAYDKLEDFLSAFRQCAQPSVASGEENGTASLVYQANLANAMKELLDVTKGQSKEQGRALEQIVDQFIARMNTSLSGEFERLGQSLKIAGESQTACVSQARELTKACEALLNGERLIARNNQAMLEQLQRMSKEQERMAEELAGQRELLSRTCKEMSDEVSNQLYTYNQMRDDDV